MEKSTMLTFLSLFKRLSRFSVLRAITACGPYRKPYRLAERTYLASKSDFWFGEMLADFQQRSVKLYKYAPTASAFILLKNLDRS